jgi:hypothetical protein
MDFLPVKDLDAQWRPRTLYPNLEMTARYSVAGALNHYILWIRGG